MTTRWNSEQDFIQALENRVRDLERLLAQDQEAWYPEKWRVIGAAGQPAFTNSWVNYGSPFSTAAFRKEKGGVVRLRGVVRNGTVATGMWTLPVGYRPPATAPFGVHGSGSEGRVDITSAGVVTHIAGGNSYIFLDGIAFVVAA